MGVSDDTASQLIQGMAGFGSADAGDSLHPASSGTEALQQQQFVTMPQHA
jgi:hypothetical protein